MTDLVKIDVDAMAKLVPQVQALVGEIKSGLPSVIPAGATTGADTVPSLAAAQQMSNRTVPTVRAAVGERFNQVAELCEQAGKRFLIADSQLTMAWNKMPTLLRPPS